MADLQQASADTLDPSGNILIVRITSSDKVYFDGRAASVSSFNKIGPFDILGRHENFITMLKDKVTIVDTQGKRTEFPCTQGLLEVSENRVRIFLGI